MKQALVAGIAAGGALGASTSTAAASRGALSPGGAGTVASAKVGAWLAAGAAVGLATAGAWVGLTGGLNGQAPRAPATVIVPRASSMPPVERAPAVEGRLEAALVEVSQEAAPAEMREVTPPISVAPSAKVPRQKAAAFPSQTPRVTAASSLTAETALLQAARAALGGGDARGALALLRQHARDYPNGALVEERLASEVFAACALGQRASAARAAAELTRRAPSSPLRARVLDSCAGE